MVPRKPLMIAVTALALLAAGNGAAAARDTTSTGGLTCGSCQAGADDQAGYDPRVPCIVNTVNLYLSRSSVTSPPTCG